MLFANFFLIMTYKTPVLVYKEFTLTESSGANRRTEKRKKTIVNAKNSPFENIF